LEVEVDTLDVDVEGLEVLLTGLEVVVETLLELELVEVDVDDVLTAVAVVVHGGRTTALL
jgi:hypothetical protein